MSTACCVDRVLGLKQEVYCGWIIVHKGPSTQFSMQTCIEAGLLTLDATGVKNSSKQT